MSADHYLHLPERAETEHDANELLRLHPDIERSSDVAFMLDEVRSLSQEFAQALASDLATIHINTAKIYRTSGDERYADTLASALRAHGIPTFD